MSFYFFHPLRGVGGWVKSLIDNSINFLFTFLNPSLIDTFKTNWFFAPWKIGKSQKYKLWKLSSCLHHIFCYNTYEKRWFRLRFLGGCFSKWSEAAKRIETLWLRIVETGKLSIISRLHKKMSLATIMFQYSSDPLRLDILQPG